MIVDNSSKKNMEQVFIHLSQIKQVKPNANLYAKTLSKINGQKLIPIFWARAIACLLIAFIFTELYFTTTTTPSKTNDITVVIYKSTNNLYNE